MADKLPAPIQYNRPVTKARPQDPRRFESHDVHSTDAQQDPVYQKMVQDIEALQQRQGWLAGRGAFDKDDLLYLKHKQEEERLREQEQRESEAAAFAAARARAAQMEQEAAKTSFKQSMKQLTKQSTKAMQLQTLVKVKPCSKDLAVQDRQLGEQPEDLPDAKRLKITGASSFADKEAPSLHSTNKQAAIPEGSEPAESAQTDSETIKRSQQQTGLCSSAKVPKVEHEPEQPSGALEGLLGGYGSDEEDSECVAEDRTGKPHYQQQSQQQNSQDAQKQLPSAAQLLEEELPDGSFAQAHQQQTEAAAGQTLDSAARPIRGNESVYLQQGSWV